MQDNVTIRVNEVADQIQLALIGESVASKGLVKRGCLEPFLFTIFTGLRINFPRRAVLYSSSSPNSPN
jgi:hypothetical protein